MKRVIATAAQGPKSPAFRIRIGILRNRLLEQGVDVRLMPLFDDAQAAAFAGGNVGRRLGVVLSARRSLRRNMETQDAETVFVQRHTDMLPTLQLERLVSANRRLILDLDDAIWLEGPVAGGHPLAILKRSEWKVRWLAQRADVVLAGNALLAEHLSAWTDEIQVVPSLVDVDASPVRTHTDGPEVTLGWIGSPTTVRYLAQAGDLIARFAASIHPRPVRLLAVGGTPPPVRGVRLEHLAWSEPAEKDALARMDIGLMPLPDTPWTRGKCAYKALQYMAAGIPVVADNVGVTASVVGDAGCVVDSRDAWVEALNFFADSPSTRSELGSRGRSRVAADFSVSRWLPVIAGALKGD